jgi:hypothetical protein
MASELSFLICGDYRPLLGGQMDLLHEWPLVAELPPAVWARGCPVITAAKLFPHQDVTAADEQGRTLSHD